MVSALPREIFSSMNHLYFLYFPFEWHLFFYSLHPKCMKEKRGQLLIFFWQDNENFVEDGIQIEPFNLDKERQEGYFDAQGNFVEYVSEKEIKVKYLYGSFSRNSLFDDVMRLFIIVTFLQDAWLDSVEVDTKLASRISVSTENEDDHSELSSGDIGKIKRRIADSLQPGETVSPIVSDTFFAFKFPKSVFVR